MQKIIPCLWFDNEAEEAAEFYTSIFPNSKIKHIEKYVVDTPSNKPIGSVMTVTFELNGKEFMALNGGDFFKPNPSISFHIKCKTIEEVDSYYEKLSENGKSLFKFLWENLEISNLRAHNIQIVFFLSKCPDDYIERYSSEIFSFITNGRYRGLIGKIFGITCMFYSPKKIVCVLRNIYGDTDEDISSG